MSTLSWCWTSQLIKTGFLFKCGQWILWVSAVRHEIGFWATTAPSCQRSFPFLALLPFQTRRKTSHLFVELQQLWQPIPEKDVLLPLFLPASDDASALCWMNFSSGCSVMSKSSSAHLPHYCASKPSPQHWRPSHGNQNIPSSHFGPFFILKESQVDIHGWIIKLLWI